MPASAELFMAILGEYLVLSTTTIVLVTRERARFTRDLSQRSV